MECGRFSQTMASEWQRHTKTSFWWITAEKLFTSNEVDAVGSSAEDSLKQWLPNGKLLLLSLTKCHGVPCSLPSRITTKIFKKETTRLFLQDRDQDQDQMFKTKTKTFNFVLEAPRD